MAPLTLCPLHDVHVAAGGRSQVAVFVGEGDACRSRPLRGGPYHLHAHRLDDAFERGPHGCSASGQRALWGRLPPGKPAPLRQAGEKRSGGPRGYPSGRRPVPPPRAQRAFGRPVAPLRPHLDADRRFADGRRPGPCRPGPPRGEQFCWRGRRVRCKWPGDQFPWWRTGRCGFPASYPEKH